jgi:hypothetical protein
MAKTEQPSSTDRPGEPRESAAAAETAYVDPYHDLLERLARAELSDPAGVLGPHPVDRPGGRALAIRTIQPTAIDVRVRLTEGGEEFLRRFCPLPPRSAPSPAVTNSASNMMTARRPSCTTRTTSPAC